jgi:hypothetical protein
VIGITLSKAALSEMLHQQCAEAIAKDESICKQYAPQEPPEKLPFKQRPVRDVFKEEISRLEQAQAETENTPSQASESIPAAVGEYDLTALAQEAAAFMNLRRKAKRPS